MFTIAFKSSVEKDLRHLQADISKRVLERIEALKTTPFPKQASKLSGAERLYRIRISDYRVVYEVEAKEKKITIHYVRHRREVYRGM